jgi:hypothetical protein
VEAQDRNSAVRSCHHPSACQICPAPADPSHRVTLLETVSRVRRALALRLEPALDTRRCVKLIGTNLNPKAAGKTGEAAQQVVRGVRGESGVLLLGLFNDRQRSRGQMAAKRDVVTPKTFAGELLEESISAAILSLAPPEDNSTRGFLATLYPTVVPALEALTKEFERCELEGKPPPEPLDWLGSYLMRHNPGAIPAPIPPDAEPEPEPEA